MLNLDLKTNWNAATLWGRAPRIENLPHTSTSFNRMAHYAVKGSAIEVLTQVMEGNGLSVKEIISDGMIKYGALDFFMSEWFMPILENMAKPK
jgi:hypothetical protein